MSSSAASPCCSAALRLMVCGAWQWLQSKERWLLRHRGGSRAVMRRQTEHRPASAASSARPPLGRIPLGDELGTLALRTVQGEDGGRGTGTTRVRTSQQLVRALSGQGSANPCPVIASSGEICWPESQ